MDQDWFDNFRKTKEYQFLVSRPIAYFCFEFALADDSPTFAGGLGILAGDVVHEAADQHLPLVAVGLSYHQGYKVYSNPQTFGFEKVVDNNGQPLLVNIPLAGRTIWICTWEMRIASSVRIFLLDTDIVSNDVQDRDITNKLYIANKETRFKQEMVLGIGGLRMLKALSIHPSIYHLNEGHSALLALEVAHHEMEEHKKGFLEELDHARQHIIFTNHTLIAAGNDMFNIDMISALINDYSRQVELPTTDIINFGLIRESSLFSMTTLALTMAYKINAVSKIHARKALEIWPDHPMLPITNGIHIGRWDKIKIQNSKFKIQNDEMWKKHQENKNELLDLIKNETDQEWSEDDLLIGWGRRMVGYKRPMSLFADKERLLNLIKDKKRPLRIVISGSAHESDIEGARMLEVLREMIESTFKGFVVYLPNYNLKVAKVMTAGCDVWLNTPVVGFEACGTSGMKACLNGVLPCSTKDGWIDEVDLSGIGWIADNNNLTESLLNIIDQQIIPLYYFRDKNNIPGGWIENMIKARALILNQFNTTRMLREYISLMYISVIDNINK
jgi:glycogen phosphorylase